MSAIKAIMTLDIAQLQAQLAKARGDVAKFKEQAKKESAGTSGGVLAGVSNELSGLLPAMGVAAVVGGIRSIMGEMDDLADVALKLGESTETIQRVSHASTILAGVDINGVAGAFLKLEKALGDVDNAAGADALARYGVTAEGLTRLSLDEKIIKIANAFQRSRAEGTGYNDLLVLLGKSAGDMIPMFLQTEEVIRSTFAEAGVVPDEFIQSMAVLNDKLDSFNARAKAGAGAALGGIVSIVEKNLGLYRRLFDGENPIEAFMEAWSDPQSTATNDLDREKERTAAAIKARREAAAAVKAEADAAKLGAARERTADVESTNPQRLEAAAAKYREINAQIEAGLAAGKDVNELELQRESIKQRLLGLSRQITEEAEREAEMRSQQETSASDAQAELKILREEAAGHKAKADAAREKLQIDQQSRQIAKDQGISEEAAKKQAEEMVRLKKEIAEDASGGGKIHGYSRETQGDARAARERGESGISEARKKRDDVVAKMGDIPTPYEKRGRLREGFQFPSLDEMKKKPGGSLRDTFDFPSLKKMENPLGDKAQTNSARDDAAEKGKDQMQTTESILAEIRDALNDE